MSEIFTLPVTEERSNKLETATRIMKEGIKLHDQNHGKESLEPKDYHGPEHIEILLRYAKKIAEILNLSPKEFSLLKMALAYHDTVIKYDLPREDEITGMIKRLRGAREGDMVSGSRGNEGESAKLLKTTMSQTGVFTEEEIDTAVLAIEATYPAIDAGPDFKGAPFKNYAYYSEVIEQNQELKRIVESLKKRGIEKGILFSQPHLEKPLENGENMPLEVVIIALVDLGGAGLLKSEEFFQQGDAEMHELYPNIRKPEILKSLLEGEEDNNVRDRKKVSEIFFKWIEDQVGFITWQAFRFEKIIYLLKEKGRIEKNQEKGLRELFCNYSDNIEEALLRADNLKREYGKEVEEKGERAAFVSLMQSMHYKI